MSYQDSPDLEKQPMMTAIPVSPNSPRSISALESYQILVGDIDKPIDMNDDSLYHAIITEERRSKHWYIVTAILIYTAIAAQVILCLGIVVGAQRNLGNDEISILAAVNTAVAATIGVLKALGLPDKKSIERRKLQHLAERIRLTTRKLKAGLIVDASEEADAVRKTYEQTEEEAQFETADFSNAAGAGLKAFKRRG